MYKPKQLSYTNTVSNMGMKMEDKELNDYYDIRDKYERLILTNLMKKDEGTQEKFISGDIFSFVKEDKINEFMDYFNNNNLNIRRRKEFLDRDTMNHDIVTVFSKEFNEDSDD